MEVSKASGFLSQVRAAGQDLSQPLLPSRQLTLMDQAGSRVSGHTLLLLTVTRLRVLRTSLGKPVSGSSCLSVDVLGRLAA